MGVDVTGSRVGLWVGDSVEGLRVGDAVGEGVGNEVGEVVGEPVGGMAQ